MDDDYDALGPLRDEALDTIADNAVALRLPPTGEAPPAGAMQGPAPAPTSSAAASPAADGPFQVALGPKSKAAVIAQMRATGADKGFDKTLGQITGGEFSPEEIQALKDRALNAASWLQVFHLRGVSEGAPVVLSPAQKATIDSLMGQLGSDALAAKARAAYGRAINAGNIRVR